MAGEQRALVRRVVEALEEELGRNTVLYYEWYEYYIAGHDADLKLQKIYHDKADLVIPCISSHYGCCFGKSA